MAGCGSTGERPHEMQNVYADPVYAEVVVELKAELERLRDELRDYE